LNSREDCEFNIKLAFSNIDEDPIVDLMLEMLMTDPRERITAQAALKHEAFKSITRPKATDVDIITEILRYAEVAKSGLKEVTQKYGKDVVKAAESRLRQEPPFFRIKIERYRNILVNEFLEATFNQTQFDENETAKWQTLRNKFEMPNSNKTYRTLEYGFRHGLRPEEVNMLAAYLHKSGQVEKYCNEAGIAVPGYDDFRPFQVLARLPEKWFSVDKKTREAVLSAIEEAPQISEDILKYMQEKLPTFSRIECKSLFARIRIKSAIFDTPLAPEHDGQWIFDFDNFNLNEKTARQLLTMEINRFTKRLPRKHLTGLADLYPETPALFGLSDEMPEIRPDGFGIQVELDSPLEQADINDGDATANEKAEATRSYEPKETRKSADWGSGSNQRKNVRFESSPDSIEDGGADEKRSPEGKVKQPNTCHPCCIIS